MGTLKAAFISPATSVSIRVRGMDLANVNIKHVYSFVLCFVIALYFNKPKPNVDENLSAVAQAAAECEGEAALCVDGEISTFKGLSVVLSLPPAVFMPLTA